MPTRVSGRVTLIVAILLIALWTIFPSFDIRHLNLKPGIDMVGGTSLIYEIKPPPGGFHGQNLAEAVISALKTRVDPLGNKNLIWRPQGSSRLEIQMPLSTTSGKSRELREAYAQTQRELEATNVHPATATAAIESLSGAEREKKLESLAAGSTSRLKLLQQAAVAYDAVKSAHARRDAEAEAKATIAYEDLKAQLPGTNLEPAKLEAVLATEDAAARDAKLKELRDAARDYPERLAAVNNFVTRYQAFVSVKGSIDDAAELKRLLTGSGVLEYHILASDLSDAEYQRMVQRLDTDGPQPQAGDTVRWYEAERPDEFKGDAKISHEWNNKLWVLVYVTPDKSLTKGSGRWALESASAQTDPEGMWEVIFNLDQSGGKLFGDLTGRNIGKPLGVVLDNRIVNSATIQSQIWSTGNITNHANGGFTSRQVNYLVNTLNAGSLPAQLEDEPISEKTVGPQLGADNLAAGLKSCFFGLAVVGVFLIGYYYLAGVVAFFAVCMNLVLILGTMAGMEATFTLPGIAGIVLTIGAAVDANVLIFERLREEQQRGMSLNLALRNAYGKAWTAIFDSNFTTVITSALLVFFGSEEVKGFGITLLIGLISSLFTSLFVTKTIFAVMVNHLGVTKLGSLPLTFPKWDRLLKPKIDWMGKAWAFVSVSVVLIVAGVWSFGFYLHKGEVMDIDFAGGTSVQVDLTHAMSIEQVRALLPKDDSILPSPQIVAVGGDRTSYSIDTANTNAQQVRQELLKLLGDNLRLERESRFDDVGKPLDSALNSVVFPIDHAMLSKNGAAITRAAGFPPQMETLRDFGGGAAIVLRNLDPPLSPSEIRDRLERQRLQPAAGEQQQPYRETHVEASGGPDQKTDHAIVLISDPNLPYDKDPAKWRESLAGPTWRLINDSINKPGQLRRVDSFDAQVAGDTSRDALAALTASVIVIMIFIWLRFGNATYGTATVVAMLHDTIQVVGAIGLAHLICAMAPALGVALALEPFRLNLTMVAAILTVMSYSMIDTIVVFDRIRENRGRYGHLDRDVVNNSINQTLSRTLLTAGTNVVTVFVMYVFGGPGIHGFTFILLFGILVGTYSSIAIAAPILLIARHAQVNAGNRPVARLQRT
jgi:SecD/SecF fusion protein